MGCFSLYFALVRGLIITCSFCFGSPVNVITENGILVGNKFFDQPGSEVYSFQGVPYAEPPVKELRWQLPKPKTRWRDPWDARQFRWMCPQNGKYQRFAKEDCLYLNVVTPSIESTRYLPVLFWIHGGDFKMGSSAEFPIQGIAANLVTRRVVVVTINYRLGIFGFYSPHQNHAPGNLAFHDQILALKWVRKNIHFFGGDSEKITIFGQGAGSLSVGLHTVSPLSKGLFRRAIMQSGFLTQLKSGANDRNGQIYRNISGQLGCLVHGQKGDISPTAEKLSCMKRKSMDELLEVSADFENHDFIWEPVVDGNFLIEKALDEDNLESSFNCDEVIIGMNRDEAGYEFLPYLLSNRTYIEEFTKRKLVEEIGKLVEKIRGKNRHLIRRLVTALYANGVQEFFGIDIAEDYNYFWLDQTIKLYTEAGFGGPIMREINSLLRQGSTVYFYQYDYLSPSAFSPSPWRGVIRGSEVPYIFGNSEQFSQDYWNFTLQASDYRISKILGILWTNFAKYGDPTPHKLDFTWLPATENFPSRYLSLKPNLEMKEMFSQRSVNFWAKLVPELLKLDIKTDSTNVSSNCIDWIYLWITLGVLFALIVFCFAVICLFESHTRAPWHLFQKT